MSEGTPFEADTLDHVNNAVRTIGLAAPGKLVTRKDLSVGATQIILAPDLSQLGQIDLETTRERVEDETTEADPTYRFGLMLRVWQPVQRKLALAIVNYTPAEAPTETWKLTKTASYSKQEPVRHVLYGRIDGPLDYLIVAATRDVTLSLTDPSKLHNRVPEDVEYR